MRAAGSDAAARSVYFWGATLEDDAPNMHLSPVLAASTTKAADDVSFASAGDPFRTEGYWFDLWPDCTATEMRAAIDAGAAQTLWIVSGSFSVEPIVIRGLSEE